MNADRISITIVIASIAAIAYLSIGTGGFSQNAIGQAEETFSQNFTFLEEVEQMQTQRQTEEASQVSENQTNTTTTPILDILLQEQRERPSSDMISSFNDIHEPRPHIVISNDNVYVVWETNETGDWEIMWRSSNNNGGTFGDKMNLSNSPGLDSENVEIAASGSKVYASWHESSPANSTNRFVLRSSNDNGLTFGPIFDLSGNGTIGEKQTFTTYRNSSYGIQVQYPSDWRINFGEGNSSVVDIAGFISPDEYRLDTYEEKLWISIDRLDSGNITLQEYANEVVDYKNETLRDFELLYYDTDSTILAGYPGYRLVYTSTIEQGMNIKQMEIGTKIGTKVYFLDYYAEKEKYPDYLPVIHKIISSFKIQDN